MEPTPWQLARPGDRPGSTPRFRVCSVPWHPLGAVLALALLAGCGKDTSAVDDAGPPIDAGLRDSGAVVDGFSPDARAVSCTTSAECQDGLYCNGIEICGADGTCVAGAAACVTRGAEGACDESADVCVGMCEAGALGPPPRCTAATDCDDDNVCTNDLCLPSPFGDARGCSHRAATACAMDSECDDHVFCDGVEQCMPGAPQADCRGCVRPTGRVCPSTMACSEASASCVAVVCGDTDGDGRVSAFCGGDDCSDGDPWTYPGGSERCDASLPDGRPYRDHDEDCNPETIALTGLPDGDDDRDGFIAARCCNRRWDGSDHCGPDCDDHDPDVHPEQVEVCNGVDDNCDGLVDEGTTVALYVDADGDGAGNGACAGAGCLGSAGTSPNRNDCDDTNPAVRGRGDIECGSHGGTRTCGALGAWDAETDCPGGLTCRPQPNGTGLCL